MQKLKIGKKFPWKNVLMGIIIIVLILVVVGLLVPSFMDFMLGGIIGIGIFLMNGAISCALSLYFWVGFGLMGAVFFIYFYRKNYAKKTVLTGTGSLGTTGIARDTLAEPALFDDDMKVESA